MSELPTNRIVTGDATNELATMPADSVHMCMTSPPYWQLRDYGEEGQLGLEETPEEFVENIASVMDEVKRVLRPDGSLWLNLGDTYDDKDLQQIPARVALELQSRGWVLRNRVTWAKPNPMPNSVKDRLNTTTEAIFHLTPSKSYWYDLDSIRESYSEASKERYNYGYDDEIESAEHQNKALPDGNIDPNPAGKNPGDVFEVTTKPFPDAHFAVYPPELCEKPIKATCPPKVCAGCGTPYEREVERSTISEDEIKEKFPERFEQGPDEVGAKERQDGARRKMSGPEFNEWKQNNPDEFKGWRQSCDCDTDAPKSGIALDPFSGAGTTLLKAKELGRKFVGIELNPEYADMARARIGLTPNNPETIRDAEQSGFEVFAND